MDHATAGRAAVIRARGIVWHLISPPLPASVKDFYAAAGSEAERMGDGRALHEASAGASLAWILRSAQGCRQVAEIGTSAGWTAIALALADPHRQITTVDPFPHPHLDRYLALVPINVRERIRFIQGYGRDGPPLGLRVDFLFIDDDHQHDSVVEGFNAWRKSLAPGARVVFHDYHQVQPGVISAVSELGLRGKVRANMLLWRNASGDP